MSGHSKWSRIKRKKGVKDQKRGQIFTKLGNAVALAAREGGSDPEKNFKLRLAIEKAQKANMPKDKIKVAIERGGGGKKGQEQLSEVLYEGYGPKGVAVLVECATDNRQKTASEMKYLFDRGGGSLGGPGSVAYQFQRKGLVTVKTQGKDEETLMEAALVAGADDIEYDEEETEIYTKPADLMKVKEALESGRLTVTDAGLVYQPVNMIQLEKEEDAKKLFSFMEMIEENESVQKVYANFDIEKSIVEKVE